MNRILQATIACAMFLGSTGLIASSSPRAKFILSDAQSTSEFGNIIDARPPESREGSVQAKVVTFADSMFQSEPVDALRADLDAYVEAQWGANKLRKQLSSRRLALTRLEVTFITHNRESTIAAGRVSTHGDLMAYELLGYGGDLSVRIDVEFDGQIFTGHAFERFVGNGQLLSYSTRSLFRDAVYQVARRLAASGTR